MMRKEFDTICFDGLPTGLSYSNGDHVLCGDFCRVRYEREFLDSDHPILNWDRFTFELPRFIGSYYIHCHVVFDSTYCGFVFIPLEILHTFHVPSDLVSQIPFERISLSNIAIKGVWKKDD